MPDRRNTDRESAATVRSDRLSSVLAITVALGVTVLLLSIGSERPSSALRAFFAAPLTNTYYFGNMLSTAGYLLVAALGVLLAFRSGLYNIGGEGQIFVSALVGTLVGLWLPPGWGIGGTLAVLAAATLTGALLSGLSGLGRQLWGAPELITSYLLSAALVPAAEYLITGPANDPDRSLLATRTLPASFWLPRLLPPSELNLAFVLAIAAALLVFTIMYYTVVGYELRLFGLNQRFAVYAGISAPAFTIGSMTASGALHGMTGALMVLGTHHAAISGFTGGTGWNAIAVALIGRLHPLGAIVASLVFAYLDAGAKASMLHTSFTFELGHIIQAVIFFFVTARLTVRAVRRRREHSR